MSTWYLFKIFYFDVINFKRKIFTWTWIRIWAFSFTHWNSNQLSHSDKPLDQARILLLFDPHYPHDQHFSSKLASMCH